MRENTVIGYTIPPNKPVTGIVMTIKIESLWGYKTGYMKILTVTIVGMQTGFYVFKLVSIPKITVVLSSNDDRKISACKDEPYRVFSET